MNYLLDTNIVLIYTQNSPLTKAIEATYNLFNGKNRLYLSVVTVAELKSIVLQRNYGEKKQHLLVIMQIILLTFARTSYYLTKNNYGLFNYS